MIRVAQKKTKKPIDHFAFATSLCFDGTVNDITSYENHDGCVKHNLLFDCFSQILSINDPRKHLRHSAAKLMPETV